MKKKLLLISLFILLLPTMVFAESYTDNKVISAFFMEGFTTLYFIISGIKDIRDNDKLMPYICILFIVRLIFLIIFTPMLLSILCKIDFFVVVGGSFVFSLLKVLRIRKEAYNRRESVRQDLLNNSNNTSNEVHTDSLENKKESTSTFGSMSALLHSASDTLNKANNAYEEEYTVCPKCGTKGTNDDIYCANCGTKLK